MGEASRSRTVERMLLMERTRARVSPATPPPMMQIRGGVEADEVEAALTSER